VLQAEAGGLGVAYPTAAKIEPRSYFFPYARDLLVGLEGLAAPQARVARASDWVVTAVLSRRSPLAARHLRARLALRVLLG
jgi:hypothetical protein